MELMPCTVSSLFKHRIILIIIRIWIIIRRRVLKSSNADYHQHENGYNDALRMMIQILIIMRMIRCLNNEETVQGMSSI